MAFQAQSAPNYQGAASDIGGMFARKGKAFLTWAQAKRDRDERAASIEVQRGRETRATIMGALKEAGRLGAEERRMGFAKDKWEEGSAKRISDLKNSLNYDHRVEVSRKAAQYDAYVKEKGEYGEDVMSEEAWLAQPGNALKTTAVSFEEAKRILELKGQPYTGTLSNAEMKVDDDEVELVDYKKSIQEPTKVEEVPKEVQPLTTEQKTDPLEPSPTLGVLKAGYTQERLAAEAAEAELNKEIPPPKPKDKFKIDQQIQKIAVRQSQPTPEPEPEPKPTPKPQTKARTLTPRGFDNIIRDLSVLKEFPDAEDVKPPTRGDLVSASEHLRVNAGTKLRKEREQAVKELIKKQPQGFTKYYEEGADGKPNYASPQNEEELVEAAKRLGKKAPHEVKHWLREKKLYDDNLKLIDNAIKKYSGDVINLGKSEGDEAPPRGKYNGETLTSETGGSDANVAVLDPAKESALVSEETDTLASAVTSTPKPSYKEFGASGKKAASLFFKNRDTKAAKAYKKYEESGYKNQAALTEAYKQTYGFGGFRKLKGGTAAGLKEWYDNTKGNSTQRKAFLKYVRANSETNPRVINQMTEKLVNELYQTPEVVGKTGGEGTPGSKGELIKILDANPNYENYVPASVTKKSKAGHAWFEKLSGTEQKMINDLDASLQGMEGGYFRVRGWDVNEKTLFGRSVLLSKEENDDVLAKAAKNQNTVLSRNTAVGFTLNKYKEKLEHVNAPLVWENVDENIKKQWFSSFWQSGTSGTHRTKIQELNKLYKDNAPDADIESKINEVNTAFYGAGGAHMGGRVYARKMEEAYALDGGTWVKEHLAGKIKSARGGDGALFNQEKWLSTSLRPDTKPIFDRAVTASNDHPENGATIEYTKDGDLVFHDKIVSNEDSSSAYFRARPTRGTIKHKYRLRQDPAKRPPGEHKIEGNHDAKIHDMRMVGGKAWYEVSYIKGGKKRTGWIHQAGLKSSHRVRFDATGSQKAFTDLMINAPQMKNRRNKLSKELGLAQRSLQSVTLKGPASVNVRDDSANEVRKIYRGTPVLVDKTRTKTMKVAGNYINYIWAYGTEGKNGGWISKNTVTASAPKTVAGRNIYGGNVAAFDDKHNKVGGQSFPKYADIEIALEEGEPLTREIDGKKYVKAKVKGGTTWFWGSASSLQVNT